MASKANKGNKRLKDYGKVLMAKQLLRAIYNNPREKVFKRFFGKKMEAKFTNGSSLISEPKTSVPTINKVFTGLSSRLEIILTAMGGALSFQHARQLINHGKVSVNGYTVKQRSYLLKDGDIIVSKAGLNFSESNTENTLSIPASVSKGRFTDEREKRQALFQLEKKVGGMKTAKIPGFLKIKTPIAASLLVNPELNLGIYYSKPLFNKNHVDSTSGLTESTTGWKNMSVKELKLLLAPTEGLSSQVNSESSKGKIPGSLSLAKQEQVKWENLYSLVQAYYLRK